MRSMKHPEIIEAGKAANVHDFISGLKYGYDIHGVETGDRGLKQRQRIAIAIGRTEKSNLSKLCDQIGMLNVG